MSDYHDITLAILAGGEGSRLGKPKAELRINDKPILEYLLDRFAWPGPTLLVTAPGREKPPGAERFTREAVDPVAGAGPLRGVLTALENTSTPLVIVTAVDMPLVESTHLRQLVDEMRARSALLGLMTRHPEPPGHSHVLKNIRASSEPFRIEPFPGIFHIDAAAVLHERLASRQFSVARLTRDPAFAAIDVAWDPSVWLNMNSASDVQHMIAQGLRITGFQPVSQAPSRVESP